MNPFIEYIGEGKQLLDQLCHMALKGLGLEAHAIVTQLADHLNKSAVSSSNPSSPLIPTISALPVVDAPVEVSK